MATLALRERFVASRSGMRTILARYTGTNPRDLLLEATTHGKPFLVMAEGLEFNLTHSDDSHDWAGLAIGNRIAIGFDCEKIKPLRDLDLLARRVLSESEYAWLQAVEDFERLVSFYELWTRKEAAVKALGHGLAFPIEKIEVSIEDRDPISIGIPNFGKWWLKK
jgi:4'-phosphopantetheinyl transferase